MKRCKILRLSNKEIDRLIEALKDTRESESIIMKKLVIARKNTYNQTKQ